jgi:intein/homing endonuclease
MGRPKIYKINENYFDVPLNERGAYLLGLIMSDGHLDYNRGRFEYSCSEKDISLLEFIKDELQSTHPIGRITTNGVSYSRYFITNKKLVHSIINGYSLPHSNKSMNNIVISSQLDTCNISHFLRGFFDGDGSIWFGGGTYRAAYTGGENMMKSIQSILTTLNIPSYFSYRHSSDNKNSCNISINGTLHTQKFGEYLYKNSTCFLKRKRDKFIKCNKQSEHVKKRSFSLSGNEDKTRELYLSGMTQAKIARTLNLVPSSVRCCIQRLRRNNQLSNTYL